MSTLSVSNLSDLTGGSNINISGGPPSRIQMGTAQASTSGTSIDFTSIPSWVKRITVMFNGVSTNGSSIKLVQLGTSSGATTSGYNSSGSSFSASVVTTNSTAGFVIYSGAAADIISGALTINLVTGNTWVASGAMKNQTNYTLLAAGDVTLSNTLDRVRITTVNGTDQFDAGSINIMWEG